MSAVSNDRELRTQMSERLREHGYPVLMSQTLLRGDLAVAKVRCDGLLGEIPCGPTEDAYLVGLAIRPCPVFDYRAEGFASRTISVATGDVMVHDLSRNPFGNMASPFNSMFFYLSPKALLRIAEDAGVPAIQALNLALGTSRFDRTLEHLGAALLPAFAKPQEACGLFVNHVLYAASAHIAGLYGGMQVVKPLDQGGLAAWQEHRAKGILCTNQDGTLKLRVLEPPRVYRRVICSSTRQPYRVILGLHRTPPLLRRG